MLVWGFEWDWRREVVLVCTFVWGCVLLRCVSWGFICVFALGLASALLCVLPWGLVCGLLCVCAAVFECVLWECGLGLPLCDVCPYQ